MSETAFFNFNLEQQYINLNDEFFVNVLINTDNQETNTIFSKINYDTDKLEFVESSFGGSKYPGVAGRLEEDGLLKLTSFATSAYSGNNGQFVRLKFRAINTGEAHVVVKDDSKIHADDGRGTDLADGGKLPAVLTIYIGEARESTVSYGANSVEAVPVEVIGMNTKEGTVAAERDDKNVVDYSKFKECPKCESCTVSDCGNGDDNFFVSCNNYLWIIILLLLMVIFYLIYKLKTKNRNTILEPIDETER